jgi:hypothetical protein
MDRPAFRTVEVEAFCSWSMCRIRNSSSARTLIGLISYGSVGTLNIIICNSTCRQSATSQQGKLNKSSVGPKAGYHEILHVAQMVSRIPVSDMQKVRLADIVVLADSAESGSVSIIVVAKPW